MHLIDRYAYTNRLTKVNPASKAGLALAVIGLCLGLNRPMVGLAALLWMAGLTIWLAGIPAPVFARVILAEGLFLMLTSIGIGLSISLRPSGQLWQWSFGPLWLSTSPEALQQMLVILTRVIGSASALNFLALTTPMVDMVALLRRLRLPETLIDVMVIMYRFIFVLLDTLERMLTAQRSRLGYQTGYWRSMQNMGQVGARLFINAMQRSQRLETALLARGYNGTLPVLSLNYRPFPHFGWVMVILIGSLVGVRLVEPWLS